MTCRRIAAMADTLAMAWLSDVSTREVRGGAIPNIEALDGFFAALVCCPDLVMPSEYMPIIQTGATDDGDLDFESMEEAEQFIELVNRHWNHVNQQLDSKEVYLPLLFEDEQGKVRANHWAQGFILGTNLRPNIWPEIMDDESEGGAMVPIWALPTSIMKIRRCGPMTSPYRMSEEKNWSLAPPRASCGFIDFF